MTAADLPTTHGIPNNGGEGFRFLGYPAYDSIVNWDFTHTDKLADIAPGLFTAWHADETNPTALDLRRARGREVPRRLGVQRRRGDLELPPHL